MSTAATIGSLGAALLALLVEVDPVVAPRVQILCDRVRKRRRVAAVVDDVEAEELELLTAELADDALHHLG